MTTALRVPTASHVKLSQQIFMEGLPCASVFLGTGFRAMNKSRQKCWHTFQLRGTDNEVTIKSNWLGNNNFYRKTSRRVLHFPKRQWEKDSGGRRYSKEKT